MAQTAAEETSGAERVGQGKRRALSVPGAILRLEGLAALAAALWLYAGGGHSWWTFGALLLAPDLALLAYAASPRLGSAAYNLLHTYTLPLLLGLAGLALEQQLYTQLALIWTAHIGMDRAVGYGLKYAGSFKETHLQRV